MSRARVCRHRVRLAVGYGLAACALVLAVAIWITYHVLEPACVWCASWEVEEFHAG